MASNRLTNREGLTAWLFIGPFLLGFVLFRLVPLLLGLALSVLNFNRVRKIGELRFIGFSNYVRLLSDDIALSAFAKSFQYTLVFVVGTVVLALVTALALNQRFWFRTTIRSMIYMPYVANIVALSIIWSIVLDPFDGPVNTLLRTLGVEDPPLWLGGLSTALPTIAAINVWQNLAFPVIVFLAALQDVPRELYECAEIDGASSLQRFSHITLPMISPTTFFITVTSMIGSFQNYSIVRVLTNGGPGTASRVISLNIYEEAFGFNRYSYASAQALVLFVIILVITLLQWKGQKRWVHY